MNKTPIYLNVSNLRNRIDSFTLENITFKLGKGEVALIGGKNSSGKTSLLETLCFVNMPDEGNLVFLGKKVFDSGLKKKNWRETKKYIGVQFQGDSLFNNLTVWETFQLFSKNHGLEEIPKIVISCPFLQGFMDKRISKLSKGKVQLIKFLLSVMHGPKIVLLDEPVSNLDGDTRSWVHETIKKMKSNGTSFLITMNNLWSIGGISNRLITIEEGSLYRIYDNFHEYYKGCTAKLSSDFNINDIQEKDWVLGIEKRKDYYLLYSNLNVSRLLERKELPLLSIGEIMIEDFYPGGDGR
ncbi:MAG: ATP-binding cassette domain-containing protein [Candidatus Thermoplasmatota archaeon]|nr:ATP-binding cassette domain-containing protein [Candidatus Thermoplasmatota archaeon]